MLERGRAGVVIAGGGAGGIICIGQTRKRGYEMANHDDFGSFDLEVGVIMCKMCSVWVGLDLLFSMSSYALATGSYRRGAQTKIALFLHFVAKKTRPRPGGGLRPSFFLCGANPTVRGAGPPPPPPPPNNNYELPHKLLGKLQSVSSR